MVKRFNKEIILYNSGVQTVIGVDEVGRGPLAGPVVAAAVIFRAPILKLWWKQIEDSKFLAEQQRSYLSQRIMECAQYGIGVATVEEIEQVNILQASLLAMRRAVETLVNISSKIVPNKTTLLIDGRNIIPDFGFGQEAIVKGDSSVHSIAAGSIIAKVYRDKMMKELHEQYPNYGFAQHKGYGTRQHISAIQTHGLSPIHRVSFCSNFI